MGRTCPIKPQLHSVKCVVDGRGREVGVGESKLLFWEEGIPVMSLLCARQQWAGTWELDAPWVVRDQGLPLAKRKQRFAVANTTCFSGSLWGPMTKVQEESP